MIVVAVIAALGAIASAGLALLNRQKLIDIHLLVNSRLDQALSEIDDLKTQRDIKQDRVSGQIEDLKDQRNRVQGKEDAQEN